MAPLERNLAKRSKEERVRFAVIARWPSFLEHKLLPLKVIRAHRSGY